MLFICGPYRQTYRTYRIFGYNMKYNMHIHWKGGDCARKMSRQVARHTCETTIQN